MKPQPGDRFRVDTHLHRLDGEIVMFVKLSTYWGWWIVTHGGQEYGFFPGELKPL